MHAKRVLCEQEKLYNHGVARCNHFTLAVENNRGYLTTPHSKRADMLRLGSTATQRRVRIVAAAQMQGCRRHAVLLAACCMMARRSKSTHAKSVDALHGGGLAQREPLSSRVTLKESIRMRKMTAWPTQHNQHCVSTPTP
jgi:hypothetical protein